VHENVGGAFVKQIHSHPSAGYCKSSGSTNVWTAEPHCLSHEGVARQIANQVLQMKWPTKCGHAFCELVCDAGNAECLSAVLQGKCGPKPPHACLGLASVLLVCAGFVCLLCLGSVAAQQGCSGCQNPPLWCMPATVLSAFVCLVLQVCVLTVLAGIQQQTKQKCTSLHRLLPRLECGPVAAICCTSRC
jgi:hypothetical protein